MKAHDAMLTTLLKQNDALFNIPVYQRNYDWDQDNCQQLFSDLEGIVITGKDHFLGSIVYISIGTATEPYFNIIDGQQRITSVMLFLKALHDCSDDSKFKRQVRYGFLVNLGLDGDPKMKLKQIESDSGVYEKIIMLEDYDDTQFTDNEKRSNVYQNYSYFKRLIQQSPITINDLYNAIFKLEIIDVCLTNEDPQEVFESMNSTGKSLTNTDLLRNYLLMDLPHDKQESLYKKYWYQIEKRIGSKKMEPFMVFYLIMKRKSDSINIHRKSAKINKNTLYDCYKIYYPPEKKNNEETEALLSDMSRYAPIFQRIFKTDGIKNNLDKALYELIYELGADPAAIFLMYLFDSNITEADMLAAVNACVSYAFRLRVFRGSISNQFYALAIQYFERSDETLPFVDRIWSALTSGQGSYRFPKDREFEDTFKNKNMYLEFKPQMLRYILYKFERAKTKEVVEAESVTIEHILPQNTQKWQHHLAAVNDYEYNDWINKIGNLTLTKYNSEASNEPFDEKKKIYKESGYAITREIAEYKDWTSDQIKRRSDMMAKQALIMWPLPEKYNIDTTMDGGQYDVMDDATEELFELLRSAIKEFNPSIYEDPKKSYVNFLKDKKVILSMIPNQTYLNITLNAPIETFRNPDKLEDIRNKGHWGVGECRMVVKDEEEIYEVLEYIEQMLNRKGN